MPFVLPFVHAMHALIRAGTLWYIFVDVGMAWYELVSWYVLVSW